MISGMMVSGMAVSMVGRPRGGEEQAALILSCRAETKKAGEAGLLAIFRCGSGLALGAQHLAAAIHARLEVDMVRTAKLARILVLDIGRLLQRVGRAAETA